MNPNKLPAQVEPLEDRIAPSVFVVTTLSDLNTTPTVGELSLRQAITEANGHGTSNTIVFKPGLHGVAEVLSTYGPLTITNNLTITGPGVSKIGITGLKASELFSINTSRVSISGLTMIDGKLTSGNGGAIYSRGPLTINNCVISGCTAVKGGAIYDATLGAIAITNSVLSENTATGPNAGAVSASAGRGIVISGSKFVGNSCANNAGAVLLTLDSNDSANLTIQNSVFSGNTEGYGGAVDIINGSAHGGKVIIANSQVSGNSSTGGTGALYLKGGSNRVLIMGSVFANNSSHGTGGGAYLTGGSAVMVQGCRFSGNSTQGYGGGIFSNGNPGSLTISSSTIIDNQASDGGGGIYISPGAVNVTISGTLIAENRAYGGHGGGLGLNTNTGTTVIAGSTIANNQSGNSGGGAFLLGSGKIAVQSTKLTGNVAVGAGGGMYLGSSGTHNTLSGDTFANNSSSGKGGGLYIGSTGAFSITSGSFTGNLAGGEGGGIFIGVTPNGAIHTPAVHITGNQSVAVGGGVAHAAGATGTLTINKTVITGNVGAAKIDNYYG
jgi:hypothetical protein